jgi:hypothetical protein
VSKIKGLTNISITVVVFFSLLIPIVSSDSDWSSDSPFEDEEPFGDNFEDYESFSLDFSPWIQYDSNSSPTYGIKDHRYKNQYYNGSFIIFNPNKVLPPLSDNWLAHSGNKYAACFSSTNPPNDDWLITPKMTINGNTVYIGIQCISDAAFALFIDDFNVTNIEDNGFDFSFWAKSASENYGLEKFRVGVSTTNPDPANFTIISPEPFVKAPAEWSKFAYSYEFCSIDIRIRGGFGVTASIINNDDENITDLDCSITLEDGFVLVGRQTNFSINIPAQKSVDIHAFVFGFGNPSIHIIAGRAEAKVTGKIVLFFLMGIL